MSTAPLTDSLTARPRQYLNSNNPAFDGHYIWLGGRWWVSVVTASTEEMTVPSSSPMEETVPSLSTQSWAHQMNNGICIISTIISSLHPTRYSLKLYSVAKKGGRKGNNSASSPSCDSRTRPRLPAIYLLVPYHSLYVVRVGPGRWFDAGVSQSCLGLRSICSMRLNTAAVDEKLHSTKV